MKASRMASPWLLGFCTRPSALWMLHRWGVGNTWCIGLDQAHMAWPVEKWHDRTPEARGSKASHKHAPATHLPTWVQPGADAGSLGLVSVHWSGELGSTQRYRVRLPPWNSMYSRISSP